jgi:hypothetical protein
MAAKALTYRDFNIELTDLQADGSFSVRVLGQTPGGEMRAADAERATYRQEAFSRHLGKLQRRKASRAELVELGGMLADLLLPGRVRRLFEGSVRALGPGEGLRLRLRIESLPLAALPWEYTYLRRAAGEGVDSDFLGLQRRLSIARYEIIGAPLKPPQARDKIRIVAALANPVDHPVVLDLGADRRAISAAIDDLKSKAQEVESVVLPEATRSGLLQAIRGGDIFHFSGHGTFEGAELTPEGRLLKRGQIILEAEDGTSDRVDSRQLASSLGQAGVRLVVLGACQSGQRDEGGAWTGVAPALVRENIPSVVAMQYGVMDHNAARFIAHLYTRVLGGYAIDEAVSEGRLAIYTHAGLENRDWGVPVLYLRADDGVLFPVPPAESGSAEPPLVVVQRKLGAVRGEDIGAEIGEMVGGRVVVRDEIRVVEPGGRSVGAKIDRLGGGSDG